MKAAFSINRRKTIVIVTLLLLPLVVAPLFSGTGRGRASELISGAGAAGPTDPESYSACPYGDPLEDEQEGTAATDSHDGDITPVRCISDPYPTFNSVAVDPENNIVVMSDTNRKSLLVYNRQASSKSGEEVEPLRRIAGPRTQIGFVAGVALDTGNQEIYSVNNDIEDTMMVFSYDAQGNVVPKRLLAVPHQSWGVAISKARNEVALSVQSLEALVFYRREAKTLEAPTRSLIGQSTGLADPHGVFWDDLNKELVVANHGNWGEADVSSGMDATTQGGKFFPPSITVYPDSASGDTKPLRTISGKNTRLNWPMGITVDTAKNEIFVANNGDHSVLVFRRTASGDVAPVRALGGSRTGIDRPMAVAVDARNNEIWVANFGDHTAVVFDRDAMGNAPPKRIIRNAPAGTPTSGFGNPMAVAYDSKRREILVPN